MTSDIEPNIDINSKGSDRSYMASYISIAKAFFFLYLLVIAFEYHARINDSSSVQSIHQFSSPKLNISHEKVDKALNVPNYHILKSLPFTLENLVFLHIPKTGGWSVKWEYEKRLRWTNYAKNSFIPLFFKSKWQDDAKFGPLPCPPCHIPPHYWPLNQNPYKDKFVFCIIRKTYDRLVSQFKFHSGHGFGCTQEGLNKFMKIKMNSLIDLKNGAVDRYAIDCHYLPQSEFIFDTFGNRVCHFVMRTEYLEEDFEWIQNKFSFSHPMKGRQNQAGGCKELNTSMLNQGTKRLIDQVYKIDESLFQSNFSRFLNF